MKSAMGTSVWRCIASWRPKNSVSVDVSYTLAEEGDSHPSVCSDAHVEHIVLYQGTLLECASVTNESPTNKKSIPESETC